mgnify:CR=1 FL=1
MSQNIANKVSVHTVRLLDEIQNNATRPKDMAALQIPFDYFRSLLHEVAQRCTEINDPVLDILMIKMTMYSVANPDMPDFDQEVVKQYLESDLCKEKFGG